MANMDWSRFKIRISVNAPIDKLYHGWATRAGIEHWFLRYSEYRNPDGSVKGNEEYVQKGDTYTWRWHGYPDSTEEKGEILEANGKDFFKFRFGPAGVCSVTIKKELGETFVELVQDEIPTDGKGMEYYHVGCKTGWTFHFTNMKSIFEGGADLRNKREDITDVINS
jgi:uncharacterized protein YndB with AHSA1/START domain